jgi:hypothetical protein
MQFNMNHIMNHFQLKFGNCLSNELHDCSRHRCSCRVRETSLRILRRIYVCSVVVLSLDEHIRSIMEELTMNTILEVRNFDVSFRVPIRTIRQVRITVGEYVQTWTIDANGSYRLIQTNRLPADVSTR